MPRANRWVYVLTILVFLAYVAWMLGPYIRSAIVRDASVTTWSRAAVAPIDGRIVAALPVVGSTIGEDGHVTTIRNDLLLRERSAVEDTRDRALLAQTRIVEARESLGELEELNRMRIDTRDRQIEIFHAQLEALTDDIERQIASNGEQIEILERITERSQSLVDRGTGSAAAFDEDLLRLAELRFRQAQLEEDLKIALLRDHAAEQGIFIMEDGETPDWVHHAELELRLAENRARHEVHAAEAALSEANEDLALEQQMIDALSQASVSAPPGSIVFSVTAAPGATVTAGDRIIEWIDCSDLMVDVPVSDAELPLIGRGTRAEVVLEGEAQVRGATVLLTRGSSATLAGADLAAIAKGRSQGVAQVLLTLDAERSQFEQCPVGWAAYVAFPDVGIFDVLRARLRL